MLPKFGLSQFLAVLVAGELDRLLVGGADPHVSRRGHQPRPLEHGGQETGG